MTKEEREEAIAIIRKEYLCVDRDCDIERNCGKCDLMMSSKEPILKAYKTAIQALEQDPCEDAISRQAVQDYIAKYLSQYLYNDVREAVEVIDEYIGELPSVNPQSKTGHWITTRTLKHDGEYYCDKCLSDAPYNCRTSYCPNCGCKMESEDKK